MISTKYDFDSTDEKTEAQRIKYFSLATVLISRFKYKEVYKDSQGKDIFTT